MENYENENGSQNESWYPSAAQATVEEPKPKKKHVWPKVVALALCCTVLGAALGLGGSYVMLNSARSSAGSTMVYEGNRETQSIDITQVDTGEVLTAAEIYAANVNSTVGITTSITTNYRGYQTTAAASGSGFILTADGYIVTNYHVIEDSDSVTVSFYDGTSLSAEIVGYDQSNDVAVLKVDAEGLTPVVLGSSDELNVGDGVVAIGNPLGELTFSETSGIVSALNREVTLSTGVTMDLIQTDCAINSGNSGGPLFNMYGEVIGITNAKYSSSSSSSSSSASIGNIGFAIPIDDVRSIVESIIEKGYISKPYIGVTVMSVSTEAQGYGLPAGASVQSVTEGSPADEAGLQANDIITAAGGETVSSNSDLVRIVGDCAIGDELTLTVYRQGETLELTVTIGENVQSALEDTSSQTEQSQQSQQEQQGQSGQSGSNFPWNFFGN